MRAALLLLSCFALASLGAKAQRGDHDCVPHFKADHLTASGTGTALVACMAPETAQASVALAPGEQVRILQLVQNSSYCNGPVLLRILRTDGPSHAGPDSPAWDTLEISTTLPVYLTEPGAYYCQAVLFNQGWAIASAHLQLIITAGTEAVGMSEASLPELVVTVTGDGLSVANTAPGEFSLIDMAGHVVTTTRVAGGANTFVPVPSLPAGVYIVRLQEHGRVRQARLFLD